MDVRARSNITFAGRDDGPVVMLAHGFGCDRNMWRQVAGKLGEQSRLLLFDHVGAGRSDMTAWNPDRCATLDGYARDVLEICRDLDLHDVIFVGHSVSAVIMGTPDRPELGQELTESFCRTDPAIAKAFARVTFLSDQRADPGRVRVPSLVLQSAIDAIAPPEVGAYVNAHLPDSRLVTLDATGHCPQLSAPQATAQAIASFVAECR